LRGNIGGMKDLLIDLKMLLGSYTEGLEAQETVAGKQIAKLGYLTLANDRICEEMRRTIGEMAHEERDSRVKAG